MTAEAATTSVVRYFFMTITQARDGRKNRQKFKDFFGFQSALWKVPQLTPDFGAKVDPVFQLGRHPTHIFLSYDQGADL